MLWEQNQIATQGGTLIHYGVPNMKWGRRRWQNKDGSLTPEGKIHYGVGQNGDGNKKLASKFDREMNKMLKLTGKSDVEFQKKVQAVYEKRAKTAGKVGAVASAASGAGFGEAALLKAINDKKKKQADIARNALYDLADEERLKTDAKVREVWKNDPQAYKNGIWTDHGYTQETVDRTNKLLDDYVERDDYLMRSKNAIVNDFNKGANRREKLAKVDQTVGKVAAGVAAVSLGYSGYAKARAHVAKKLTTDEGHEKAVAKAREQYKKMQKTFANTSYQSIIDKQLVASYKKEHPNTQLTDKEILKNLKV